MEDSVQNIDVHADDYAISVNSSKDILKCIESKKIDSISIIPNMKCFDECIKMLKEYLNKDNLDISIHLNFLEGHCLSNIEKVNELVDENGFFKLSWMNLFMYSYSFNKRKKVKEQLKLEIKAQIKRINKWVNSDLRIDSHQHTHMIPIVFEALIEVIEEEKYNVEYIRIPNEPLNPYIKIFSLYRTYSLKKIISNIILNIYSINAKRILKKKNITFGKLWGVIMSGKMDIQRINIIKPLMLKDKNKKIEILFHPGMVLKEEINNEFTKKSFIEFHLSENRHKEYNTIFSMNIK